MMKNSVQNNCLMAGEAAVFPRHSLLLTTGGKNGCCLHIHARERTEEYIVKSAEQGILVLASGTMVVQNGIMHYQPLYFPLLSRLQLFIDKAQGKNREINHKVFCSYLSVSLGERPTRRNIEYWFINQSLMHADKLRLFSSVLRNNEWYNLVEFLFNEFRDNPNQHLQVLCARYGLSVSHFRRLARYALGKTAKVELRDWRRVRALFELIEGNNNLTTIAMNHGYASLSHFSSEVKEVFGFSPGNLKNQLQVTLYGNEI